VNLLTNPGWSSLCAARDAPKAQSVVRVAEQELTRFDMEGEQRTNRLVIARVAEKIRWDLAVFEAAEPIRSWGGAEYAAMEELEC